MRRLPSDIKLSPHARQRLEERKLDGSIYNTKNIMRSSVKWYVKDDLILNSTLYKHCCKCVCFIFTPALLTAILKAPDCAISEHLLLARVIPV